MRLSLPSASLVVRNAQLAAWYGLDIQWHSTYALLVLTRMQVERRYAESVA
jgi:hypothetical protein